MNGPIQKKKGVLVLAEYLFRPVLWPLLRVILPLTVLQLLLMLFGADSCRWMPYEELLDRIYAPVFFLVMLAASLGVVFVQLDGYFSKTKGIYTLMTLPVPRRNIYFSFALCGFAAVLLVLAAQLFLVAAAYPGISRLMGGTVDPSVWGAAGPEGWSVTDGRLYNGLFLAFARSRFLSMLLPVSVAGWFLFAGEVAVLALFVPTLVVSLHDRCAARPGFRWARGFSNLCVLFWMLFALWNQWRNFQGVDWVIGAYSVVFIGLAVVQGWSASRALSSSQIE